MPDSRPTRIVIAGAGKSGTSGLFHCVAQSAERHFGRPFARLFEPKTQESFEALALKEANSRSVSVLELYRLAGPVAGYGPNYERKVRDLAFLSWALLQRFHGLHVLKYEDFVDRNLAAVEDYQGFGLLRDFSLPPHDARILRTGALRRLGGLVRRGGP